MRSIMKMMTMTRHRSLATKSCILAYIKSNITYTCHKDMKPPGTATICRSTTIGNIHTSMYGWYHQGRCSPATANVQSQLQHLQQVKSQLTVVSNTGSLMPQKGRIATMPPYELHHIV